MQTTQEDLKVFLFCIHDWLSHIVGDPLIWIQYDTNLKAILCSQLLSQGGRERHWLNQIIGQYPNTNTLVYRYYIFSKIIEEEIFTSVRYLPIYSLMGSLLIEPCEFVPIPTDKIYGDIDTDPHPINVLRHKRLLIRDFVACLKDRGHITFDDVRVDHGLLSSVSLLYGLYLTYVILVQDQIVRPDKSLSTIIASLSSTLTQLKGVFNNVQSHWLVPHV